MSAPIIRDEVIYRLDRRKDFDYSFIVINLANPDMLGHTGILESAVKGVEEVDKIVKEIVVKTVEQGGTAMITADHGNCETMIDRVTKEINTYHTSNPVPFIIVNSLNQCVAEKGDEIVKVGSGATAVTGMLADVAPTILNIIGLEPTQNMTGIDLLQVL
jgi:2,3-bisphosphoglycerate-independent phosphoglycerate mutase